MTEITDEARQLAALARLGEMREAVGEQRRVYEPSDFLYDTQQEAYWCLPTGSLHSAISVNAMVPMELWRIPMREAANGRPPSPIPPARDIARIESGSMVEGSTWLPGSDEIISDMYVSSDGFFPLRGARVYNKFRPGPVPDESLAPLAAPWVEHVKKLWPEPEEHEFFFDYCAHMVQCPQQKSNAGIVLSGKQGIGKDAALLPLHDVIGEWNCKNISPDAVLARFNPWVETLMLTIDEARPQSDDHRATSMYDALKTLTADPPKMLPLEDKGAKVRYVANVMRVFITTNDRLALYIPPEDRRLLVMHSNLQQKWHEAEGDADYFERFFAWIESGGAGAIGGWLMARDLSKYQPKGGVPKSDSWAEITQRWSSPDDELSQVLEMLDTPDVVLSSELSEQLFDGAEDLRRMMKGRGFVFRMQQAGYRLVPLPKGQPRWRLQSAEFDLRSNKAYVKESLGLRPLDAIKAVELRLKLRHAVGPSGKVPRKSHLEVVK